MGLCCGFRLGRRAIREEFAPPSSGNHPELLLPASRIVIAAFNFCLHLIGGHPESLLPIHFLNCKSCKFLDAAFTRLLHRSIRSPATFGTSAVSRDVLLSTEENQRTWRLSYFSITHISWPTLSLKAHLGIRMIRNAKKYCSNLSLTDCFSLFAYAINGKFIAFGRLGLPFRVINVFCSGGQRGWSDGCVFFLSYSWQCCVTEFPKLK